MSNRGMFSFLFLYDLIWRQPETGTIFIDAAWMLNLQKQLDSYWLNLLGLTMIPTYSASPGLISHPVTSVVAKEALWEGVIWEVQWAVAVAPWWIATEEVAQIMMSLKPRDPVGSKQRLTRLFLALQTALFIHIKPWEFTKKRCTLLIT